MRFFLLLLIAAGLLFLVWRQEPNRDREAPADFNVREWFEEHLPEDAEAWLNGETLSEHGERAWEELSEEWDRIAREHADDWNEEAAQRFNDWREQAKQRFEEAVQQLADGELDWEAFVERFHELRDAAAERAKELTEPDA